MFELFSFKQKNQKKYKKVHYIKKSTKKQNKPNKAKKFIISEYYLLEEEYLKIVVNLNPKIYENVFLKKSVVRMITKTKSHKH